MAREPIHPGETLREDLEALGMSAAELARRIEVPVNRITQILNGQRAVTGDTALRLGRFFGTSGEFWLNLQKLYELRRAEREHGVEIARLPSLGRRRPACRRRVEAETLQTATRLSGEAGARQRGAFRSRIDQSSGTRSRSGDVASMCTPSPPAHSANRRNPRPIARRRSASRALAERSSHKCGTISVRAARSIRRSARPTSRSPCRMGIT